MNRPRPRPNQPRKARHEEPSTAARGISRRRFCATAAGAAAGLAVPMFLPSRLFGANAPSGRLRVAQIGCGRIAHDMDMPGVLGADMADYVAVCDFDSKRASLAKEFIESYLAKKKKKPATSRSTATTGKSSRDPTWTPWSSARPTTGTRTRRRRRARGQGHLAAEAAGDVASRKAAPAATR